MATKMRLLAKPPANINRLSAFGTISLQAAPADKDGKVSGRPKFSIEAYNGGTFRPYSPYLEYPVVTDLAGVPQPTYPIPILLDHDDRQIVGQAPPEGVVIGKSNISLEGIVTGDIENPEDPSGKVMMHAKNGFTWKASVGMAIDRLEFVEAGTLVEVNGRQFAGPLYVVRAGTLDEVSVLSISADRTASAKFAARAAKEAPVDFHDWLKAKGFDPTALNDAQRESLLKMFQSEQDALKAAPKKDPEKTGDPAPKAPADPNLSLDDVLAPHKAKQQRQTAIKATVRRWADAHPESLEIIEATGRKALAADQTPEMLELELYREMQARPLGINNRPRAQVSEVPNERVFEAGLCLAGGLPNIEKHYDERTLDLANRRWRARLGLCELLLGAARANGHDHVSHRDVPTLLRAAFGDNGRMLAAGPSTFDISGILSNVANKFIVSYFDSVDSAWSRIAATRPVTDFKQITSYSLTGDFTYRKLPPGGELKHGTLGETSYTNKAETYGRMFAIDRRDIINDDLGAFMQVTQRMGRGGALSLNENFWTAFLDNAAFFVAGNNNFDDGADTALSLASLELAEALFETMTDPDGKPMGVMPRILLVPSALKRTALKLMNSTEVREVQDTAAGAGTIRAYGTANTFQGDFSVVSTPYLQNSSYTGNSATAWYLLAAPLDVPVIEVCFLNGVQRPTVESAQADFNNLGVQMRGYFDYGVAKQEPRGGVKMAGA